MFRLIYAYLVYTWGGLHRYFGNLNSMRSEQETAVRYFTRAYEIDPSFHRARLERGVLLWRELGDIPAALADFDALLDEDPQFAPALLNRAMACQDCGRFAEALADLELYLALPLSETKLYRDEAVRMTAVLRELQE